ncbi:carboxypeptidase-like regulatory domain-containing protein [Rubinisphaera margarita]|uniref:carboxypeptidase-like regulatory domain-containing protein n=1 Tax=Rubinisphaera margarita TaxID=2909586 RepID=UPI001EE8DD32|nr:carboxypeptidase-like regulatory domain-containing protein [Rubinisphaera margarita]MCG6155346.1 carboxypeptidase-like regulatory domain-containing protein [Rubinisphaera margarita]
MSPTFRFVLIPALIMALVAAAMFGVGRLRRLWEEPPAKVIEQMAPVQHRAEIEFVEGVGRLRGVIRNADGSRNTEPVRLEYRSIRGSSRDAEKFAGVWGEVTDSFDVQVPSGNTYLVAFRPRSMNVAWAGPIANHANGLLGDLELVFREGTPHQFQVADYRDNILPGATVLARPMFGFDDEGEFFPPDQVDGDVLTYSSWTEGLTYMVAASAPGFVEYRVPVRHRPGQFDLVNVYQDLIATGIVVGPDGAPVAEAEIRLSGITEHEAPFRHEQTNHTLLAKTDADGRFALSGLIEHASYQGLIIAPDYRRMTFDAIRASQEEVVFQLPPLRTVYVQLQGDLSTITTDDHAGGPPQLCLQVSQHYVVGPEGSRHPKVHHTTDQFPLTTRHVYYPGIFGHTVDMELGPATLKLRPEQIAGTGDIKVLFDLTSGSSAVSLLPVSTSEE